jgi:PLP dependent protein
MNIHADNYQRLLKTAKEHNAVLVAVSKTKPVEAIRELYDLGHRDFGENYVQELSEKQALLPGDIRWHFIGHLQTNKVKYIAPFVHLIHGIDSLKLLKEVNKQGLKINRMLDVLLQVHIAKEETKFGFDEQELLNTNFSQELKGLSHVQIQGLMGMASFSSDENLVRSEFKKLKAILDRLAQHPIPNANLQILSMGMSGDYALALEEGSNMVRIGSLIFGSR